VAAERFVVHTLRGLISSLSSCAPQPWPVAGNVRTRRRRGWLGPSRRDDRVELGAQQLLVGTQDCEEILVGPDARARPAGNRIAGHQLFHRSVKR